LEQLALGDINISGYSSNGGRKDSFEVPHQMKTAKVRPTTLIND